MRTPSSNWFLTLITVLCLASVLIQGCGAKQPDVEGGEVGSVGLAVDAGGVNLFEMYYDITGPHSYHRDAYVDISNSCRIAALIGGIPEGYGYEVLIWAYGGTLFCSGTAKFDISAGATTKVKLHLTCQNESKPGSAMISATLNVCPSIDDLTIAPSETTVGLAIPLTAIVTDPDGPNSSVTYSWTTTGGSLSGADTANALLTCDQSGTFEVTLTVSDGESACDQTESQLVSCQALEDDPSTPGDDRAGYTSCYLIPDGASNVCGPGEICCWHSPTCARDSNDCDESGFQSQGCDGPEDCPAGLECQWFKATTCARHEETHMWVLCHRDSDCKEGTCLGGSCG